MKRSVLDVNHECVVHGALGAAMQRRTKLVIDRRLATSQKADRIVVMEVGRIVDIGRYDELVRAAGSMQS